MPFNVSADFSYCWRDGGIGGSGRRGERAAPFGMSAEVGVGSDAASAGGLGWLIR